MTCTIPLAYSDGVISIPSSPSANNNKQLPSWPGAGIPMTSLSKMSTISIVGKEYRNIEYVGLEEKCSLMSKAVDSVEAVLVM